MTKLVAVIAGGTATVYSVTFGVPAAIGGSQKTSDTGILTW